MRLLMDWERTDGNIIIASADFTLPIKGKKQTNNTRIVCTPKGKALLLSLIHIFLSILLEYSLVYEICNLRIFVCGMSVHILIDGRSEIFTIVFLCYCGRKVTVSYTHLQKMIKRNPNLQTLIDYLHLELVDSG